MSTRTLELERKRRPAFLIYFLAGVIGLFIGILVYVWIESKKANPIMLDEQGRPRAAAGLVKRA